ncbi:MAG: sugar ABC transporter permease [Devosia sp.]|uniref:carbohydrate ABC transporter permease n=1 Tax=unclassified Devosia TaxID=196773 RepID=UPI001A3EC385|nr:MULTISPECIES: sugar ABC transporter permease [unclassified Devosia]MBL8596399.1 sugar ABC transporter permease [Devosia sp.]MBN9345265.1 sugar ABC transporter permease [Devosia sp.]
MFQQITGAVIAIILALAGLVIYFWGTNWLLDRLLSSGSSSGNEITRRDNIRSQIRPWLFLFPALLFLTVYLVYPVVETFRLSFFDKNGVFIGFGNYVWAFGDSGFRQSIFNNILWLLIVPFFATAFGLVIAVLADRLWWGTIAKSLVFMPMAISFVGASVIWRFVYDYRAAGENQIGLLNAIVTGFGLPPQAWITLPLWNSVFLMVILIWIQTGFAMVILSAALRGVPEETLEAARIDGANGFRIFFDIMIPQIWGTIVVVWTTITIVVLKVFDIIFAMTNGQWDTEVLANLMFKWMFVNFDYGRGSTIAVIIMLSVLPIMVWNIRRANAEEGTR